ncbi:MAG TPA: right-handed parallel beta-helix repeat-containing protein [Planctomycetota bacterium]|nr:right-handed parallel beta-helix repeat-containing protein [Planctomycetota bacterium]
MPKLPASLLVLSALAAAARADVLHVPKDFATIQDAVDAAVADDQIVIAAGSYDEVVVIAGKDHLELRGQGQVILVGGQALMASLLVDSSSVIHLAHLRFEGVLGDAIALNDSTDVTVDHCRVEDSIGAGVRVTGCDVVEVDHVVVAGTQDFGLRAQDSGFVTLSRCTVSGIDQDSVSVQGCHDVVIDRVTVDGANENGIDLLDVSSAVVRKCLVRAPTFSAISVTGHDALIEKNRMLDVDVSAGGLFSTAAGCVVRGNKVVGAGFAYNVGGAQLQLLDNRSIQSGLLGLGIGGASPAVASGNRVLKAAGTGIRVAGPDFSALADNRVNGAVVGIQVSADDVQALGNKVSGAVNDGFEVHGVGCVFLGNKAHGSGLQDLFDDSSGGNTYVDNNFGTTHFE